MRVLETSKLGPGRSFNPDDTSWMYNGLDCCLTLEIRDRLREDIEREPENVQETYATALRKMPPVLYMNARGLRVNSGYLAQSVNEYKRALAHIQANFDLLCDGVLGYTVNWRSPVQMKSLFYDRFGLKAVRKRNAQGFFVPTVNAEALEKFSEHTYIRVFCTHILAMRDIAKKLGFLEADRDGDGRRRTSLNIAGTDTGRFSSAIGAFGAGGNLQNVENQLRRPFVPDSGMVFVNVDLEQADARNVAARIWEIFYDSHGPELAGRYLDACESGDLHSAVTQMVWPDLNWTGDPDHNKFTVAGETFYREHSYRDMAKRLGHGTSYFGMPKTMALHTKTAVNIIDEFQQRFFEAFPLIGSYDKAKAKNQSEILNMVEAADNWHGWVLRQLRDTGSITNLFGRRRIFFDRWRDLRTFRAAVAYDPQSSTGEELDRGWLNLWDNMREAELLIPVHDSILFQIPMEGMNELIPQALKLLKVTKLLRGDREFTVPLEAKVGWNWADAKKDKETGLWKNEYGLKPWTGEETRQPPKQKTRLKHYLA